MPSYDIYITSIRTDQLVTTVKGPSPEDALQKVEQALAKVTIPFYEVKQLMIDDRHVVVHHDDRTDEFELDVVEV